MSTFPRSNADSYSRIMIYGAWVLFLGLLTMTFNHYSEKQDNPNADLIVRSSNGRAEVVLKQNSQGHYLAPGRINGFPVTFLLDTGATMVSIPENLAYEIGLKQKGSFEVNTANGSTMVYGTWLDSVQLGNIQVNKVRAAITPKMDENYILLGMSFLKNLELVQRNNQLILRQL